MKLRHIAKIPCNTLVVETYVFCVLLEGSFHFGYLFHIPQKVRMALLGSPSPQIPRNVLFPFPELFLLVRPALRGSFSIFVAKSDVFCFKFLLQSKSASILLHTSLFLLLSPFSRISSVIIRIHLLYNVFASPLAAFCFAESLSQIT